MFMIYAPEFMRIMPSANFSFVILIRLQTTVNFAGPLFCYFTLYKNGQSCILFTVCYLQLSGAYCPLLCHRFAHTPHCC